MNANKQARVLTHAQTSQAVIRTAEAALSNRAARQFRCRHEQFARSCAAVVTFTTGPDPTRGLLSTPSPIDTHPAPPASGWRSCGVGWPPSWKGGPAPGTSETLWKLHGSIHPDIIRRYRPASSRCPGRADDTATLSATVGRVLSLHVTSSGCCQ